MTPLYLVLIVCLLAPHAGWSGLGWFASFAVLVVLLWMGKLRSVAVFLGWSAASLATLLGLYTLYARSESEREVLEDHDRREAARQEAERDKADPLTAALKAYRVYQADPTDENAARWVRLEEAHEAAFRESMRPVLEEAERAVRARELEAERKRLELELAETRREMDRERERERQRKAPPAPRRPQPPLSTRI